MAAKRLMTEEMLQISSTWVDSASDAHKVIAANPELKPLLPRIGAVHDVLATAASPVVADPRLSQIQNEEQQIDPRHDSIIRGVHMLLTGTASLLGMEEDGADMIAARDLALPDGLESINKTYRAESGQAAQLKARLGELRPVLDSILVGNKLSKRTLTSFVNEWIEIGARLGELEDEKGRLQATTPAADGEGGAATVNARNKWIRVANALLATAELAEVDDKSMATIFGPMWAAEKVADKRGRSRSAGTTQPAGGTTPSA